MKPMINAGLYIIANQFDAFQYVGKDHKLPRRPKQHLAGKEPGCKRIHNAIMYHGKENFDVEIIRYPGISPEALKAVEKWKIRQLKTKKPYGYNLTDGGDGTSGYEYTEEHRQNLSESHKGKTLSEEHRRNISEGNKGHVVSEETKQKIAESNTGNTHTEETCRKLSVSLTGRTLSDEHKQNISKGNKGKTMSDDTKHQMSKSKTGDKHHFYGQTLSEEHRRNISEGNKGHVVSEETRLKISKGNKGKKRSDEVKRQISESKKGKPISEEHKHKLRHFDYDLAKQFFASLSPNLSLKQKRKLLRKEFVHISVSTTNRWTRKWK